MTKLSKEEIETLKHIHLQWTQKEGVSRGQMADSLNILSLISTIDALKTEYGFEFDSLRRQLQIRDANIEALQVDNSKFLERIKKVKAAFLDLILQACGEWSPNEWVHWYGKEPQLLAEKKFKGYDSKYLFVYEHALDLAAELGWIDRKEIIR
jgi:hypothetical protein